MPAALHGKLGSALCQLHQEAHSGLKWRNFGASIRHFTQT